MKPPFTVKDLLRSACNKSCDLASRSQYKYAGCATAEEYLEELSKTSASQHLDELVPNTVKLPANRSCACTRRSSADVYTTVSSRQTASTIMGPDRYE